MGNYKRENGNDFLATQLTASLDCMGGLVTYCNPQDLPEGASPRTWDCDYAIGSVFTRAGLQSVYTYAGQFVGPSAPTVALDISTGGIPWSNVNGVLGDITYSSVANPLSTSATEIPTSATAAGFYVWQSPNNVFATGAPVATVILPHSGGFTQQNTLASNMPVLSLPVGANITGVTISFQAKVTGGTGGGRMVSEFVKSGISFGSPQFSLALTGALATYTAGSPTDLSMWTLTPAQILSLISDPTFQISLTADASPGTGSSTFSANSLSFSVYYTITGDSDKLQAKTFIFAIPATSGITGITNTFKAYSTSGQSLTIQLLKNGVAVGTPKTQTLTTVSTLYTLGGGNDPWGTSWTFADLNSVGFGWQVTAMGATGAGTTNVSDVKIQVNITPGLENFNYIKSYIQNNGQTYTLALDAAGIMWQEDVTNLPKELALLKTGFLPGSFAKSATMDNREHICFSDLSIGTDRPRVYNGITFDPLSQVGPGAPPVFQASEGSGTGTLTVSSFSLTTDVATFVTPNTGFTPLAGTLYTISGVASYLNGNTYTVLASPAPSLTAFSVSVIHTDDAGPGTAGTATPAYSYTITSITQNPAVSCASQELLWSAQGNPSAPGDTITVYYGGQDVPEDPTLLRLIGNGYPNPYIYFSPAVPIVGGGTYLMTGHGINHPPHESGGVHGVPFITVQNTSSGNARYGGPSNSGPNGPGNAGTWQITLATVTTDTAIVGISTGDNLTIAGATPSGWNSNWNVVQPLAETTLDITSTQMSSLGVATYGWTIAAGTAPGVTAPIKGQLIAVLGCTNSSVFNTTGVITSVSGTNSGTLTVDGFPAGAIPFGSESGTAITYGTSFTFDPGFVAAGSTTSPIFGAGSGGQVTIVGGALQPIGAGTRQGVVFFITENGYETPMSPPITFTVGTDANFITASSIPIGPPDTIARGIAFTEAGQNGVPGANFYVIENPVTITGLHPQTYTSTIIHDNVTSGPVHFSFTDAVLLNSREVDVQGDNLFNLIELGSSAWCVMYANRMFYGLQLNKVQNFNNLTFDGGYLPNPGGNIQPLGWNILNPNDQTLLVSTVTGLSLYMQNSGSGGFSGITPIVSMITQSAFQDCYNVPIIKPATTYSVRVACDSPSGGTVGNLVIDLADPTQQTAAYGTFTIPLASMTSLITPFTGTLLTVPFDAEVPAGLLLRVYLTNTTPLSDVEIDRIEVFETKTPYLKAQVYGSYPGQPEAIDGSSTGGVLDTTNENAQACMGAFVMHDLLYLLKTQSWYSTQENPNSEPGGWSLHEVSNRVGAIGINSYDTGEEWCVTACRSGIYGFDGGQPTKISQELWNLWECIYWPSGNTIVLRNDVVSKKMYVAIPLPTGTNPVTGIAMPSVKWLPNAPYNPAPTSPNVVLMLNYQGLPDIKEMMVSPEVHTTMFGTLAAVDMKRKWSIWNIATPDMEFVMQPDGESTPLFICNGIASSKIYQLKQDQLSDDGVAINSTYTSYGFVNAAKAATLPIFGFHRKLYTVFQCAITGGQIDMTSAGRAKVRMLPNTLSPKYPYTVPVGIPLSDPVMDDFFRPINVAGNRMFVEFSTNAVGSWFNLSKMLLTGKADPHSTLNPTGGGNTGIV